MFCKSIFFPLSRNMSQSLNESCLSYDRSRLKPGILHFGVGQFCRSHLYYYTQLLFEKEKNKYDNWGIVGVNLLRRYREREMLDDLKRQKCLYTLTTFTPKGEQKSTVIGSMIDYICGLTEPEKVLKYLKDPQIKIVSLTVTEGGYNIDEKEGNFILANPLIANDLRQPKNPRTVFGYIVEGLRLRRESELKPFTIMSCDNLHYNGDVTKFAILSYAKAVDRSLAIWIYDNVCFPNSMVDRITPATNCEMREHLKKITEMQDCQPVIAEEFSQWVLENKFYDRPKWESVGAEFCENAGGYADANIRILNSSHLMLAYPGLLLGYRTVHEAIADPDIYQLVEDSLNEDVLPTLDSPMNEEEYKCAVLSRFSNPEIADQLARIFRDSCSKIQVFWTKSIVAILENDFDIENFAFGIACFIECLKGVDSNGESFPIYEPRLNNNWKSLICNKDLSAPLALNSFDAWRHLDHKELDEAIVKYRKLIHEKGCREAMPFKNS